jgi:hypothetical protein
MINVNNSGVGKALLFLTALALGISCGGEGGEGSEKEITGFSFGKGEEVVINQETNSITVYLPLDLPDKFMQTPEIEVSPGATVSPPSGEEGNFSAALVYTVVAADGSLRSYTVKVKEILVDGVWAGNTFLEHDWFTLTFKAGGRAIGNRVFAPGEDAVYTWSYTYQGSSKAGKGDLNLPSSGPEPSGWKPGGFTLGDEGKTILFDDFDGDGTSDATKVVLARMRKDTGELDPPVSLSPVPEELKWTVWAGEAVRTDDWVTVTFKGFSPGDLDKQNRPQGLTTASFTFDNTTNDGWKYRYDGGARRGDINYIGSAFSVIGDREMKFDNFFAHGVPVSLFRRR